MVYVMHITSICLLYDNNNSPGPCTWYSTSASLDLWVMNLSNTACVSGISKSASSWTSGTLSSKPWVGGAGGLEEPRNPENKRYMRYELYMQVYVFYIHGIYMVYTDVTWKRMVAADLFVVWLYIHVIYIYILYS
jgi:hypothetical protein